MSSTLAPFEPPNHVFSAFSFIAFLMCVVPLYWHLEAWNTGTVLYMFWTGLSALNLFINSVVWDGNAINSAPVWCDISTRIIIASNVAILVSSLCINRRLYKIATATSVVKSPADKRKEIFVDLSIGLGIPLLQQVMYIINEGHRFNIIEDVGCYPAVYNTPVAIALMFSWPLIIGAVSLSYCVRTIFILHKRRQDFKQLLAGNNNLSSSRYIRLMCLSGIEMVCTIPLAAWVLAINIQDGLNPWISWEDTHSNFGRVVPIPGVEWRAVPLNVLSFELFRWLIVLCAFVFFGFFGFADEAIKHYRLVYTSVASRLGYTTNSMSSDSGDYGISKYQRDMSSSGASRSRDNIKRKDSFGTIHSLDSSFDLGGDLNIDTNGTSNFAVGVAVGGDVEKGEHKPWSPTETTASSSSSQLDHMRDDEKELPRRPQPDAPASPRPVSTQTI